MSGADLTGGGPGQQDTPCGKLVLNTMLSSPKAEVVKDLVQGMVLDIGFNASRTALEVRYKNEVAGGLTTPLLPRIRHCIDTGTVFKAKVLGRNAVLIKLQVFALP